MVTATLRTGFWITRSPLLKWKQYQLFSPRHLWLLSDWMCGQNRGHGKFRALTNYCDQSNSKAHHLTMLSSFNVEPGLIQARSAFLSLPLSSSSNWELQCTKVSNCDSIRSIGCKINRAFLFLPGFEPMTLGERLGGWCHIGNASTRTIDQ